MTVTGPTAVIDSIDSAVVYLRLGNIINSLTIAATPEYVDKDNKRITNSYINSNITSVIAIVPIYKYETVPLRIDYKYGYFNTNNVEISIEPKTIRIKGELKDIKDIDKIMLTTIDEKKTSNKFSEFINMPLDIINVDNIESAEITITHKNVNIIEIVKFTEEFEIINPNDVKYKFNEDSINITLRGDIPFINYINSKDVLVKVDLTNFAGASQLPVTIEILGSYKNFVYELRDYKISVEVENGD